MSEKKDTPQEILRRDWSDRFVGLMQNRMIVSHYKYGWLAESYPTHLVDAVKSLEMRLARYRETGNTEWLVDVANFAMIEFMYPQHEKAHFEATDGDASPGLAGQTARSLLEKE